MGAKIEITGIKTKNSLILLGCALLIGILLVASSMPKEKNAPAVSRIVIDAGHGGKDPGNLGTGRYKTTEKAIALKVALLVGGYIEKAFPDVEVLYTRDDDTFVPLHERTKFANAKGADLFISVHCDAFTREGANGSGSYVMGDAKTEANLRMAQRENNAILLEEDRDENYGGIDPTSPEGLIELSLRQNTHIKQSLKFAQTVQDQIRERVGRTDRGVKQAPFWVICYTTMPSVLIELGFLTNKEEEDFLQSTQGQEYIASAIYRAFKEYKVQLESIESNMAGAEVEEDRPKDSGNASSAEADTKTLEKGAVTFKVQLLSSSTQVALEPKNFEGLENVIEYRDNDIYKYLYGAATTYDGAKNLQKDARKQGFRGAFVIAFDDQNKRIALEEAIKMSPKN